MSSISDIHHSLLTNRPTNQPTHETLTVLHPGKELPTLDVKRYYRMSLWWTHSEPQYCSKSIKMSPPHLSLRLIRQTSLMHFSSPQYKPHAPSLSSSLTRLLY